jgi:hypothetical protein
LRDEGDRDDRITRRLGHLHHSSLCDAPRPFRAIRSDRESTPASISDHLTQRCPAASRRRSACGARTELLDGSRDQLPVPMTGNHRHDRQRVARVDHHQEMRVPECQDESPSLAAEPLDAFRAGMANPQRAVESSDEDGCESRDHRVQHSLHERTPASVSENCIS